MKQCTACRKTKPLEDFNRASKSIDGHQGWCRECSAISKREARKRNPEIAALDHLKLDLRKGRKLLRENVEVTAEEWAKVELVYERALTTVERRRAAAPRN